MTRLGRLLATLALALLVLPAHADHRLLSNEVPLLGDGTSWMVTATLNGRVQGRFLLDTGASYCVVAPAFARQLALAPTGSFASVHTANGVVRAPVVRLRSVELGETRVRDVQAIVHDAVGPNLDGVVGLNFLNRFHYAVDPRRRVLTLD